MALSISGVSSSCDVIVIGAGAAGLATAIFTRRLNPSLSVQLLDSAKKPGAKILVSGGGRCNVTNAVVSEADFWGGRRTIVRRVLRAFGPNDTVGFFRALRVPLHEEADGKLFPDTNRARDVLDALLGEVDAVGATLVADCRVLSLSRDSGSGFLVATSRGVLRARFVVLATGGQSLPKSGSDGAGFALACDVGHTIVPTTPGLVPLLLEPADDLHIRLSGVSVPVELTVWLDGAAATRLQGAMLWTHFGISGPVALNASRHWLRGQLDGRDVRLTASFCPGEQFDAIDRRWTVLAADRPRSSVQTLLPTTMPASVGVLLFERLGIDGRVTLAHFSRDNRRRLAHALVEWPLAVTGSRGYNYAEVTAGGVALTEIDPATMQSRVCPGLYLVGEILDVDGRIGGFNFQWAWASGFVVARGIAHNFDSGARL